MPSDRGRARTRPLRRRVATRKVKKTVLIFCEGEKTEPEYLRALNRKSSVRDISCVDIQIVSRHGGSVPQALVSMALDARRKAADEADEIDEFWCVFDVEWPKNHPNLTSVIQQGCDNGIQFAISKSCFELWLILHFQDQSAWLNTSDALVVRGGLDGSRGKGMLPKSTWLIPHKRRSAPLRSTSFTRGTELACLTTTRHRACTD